MARTNPNSQVSQTENPHLGRRVFRVNLLYLRVISEPAVKDEAKGRFFFGADGEEDPAVDLFAQAQAAEQEEAPEKEEADENEDVEDDFEASWDILDLARTTYDTMQGDESQLKLAATYMALGDISLETGVSCLFYETNRLTVVLEKFDQAILDYKSALDIKVKLLPLENRQIAEAHFRLSLAYDMTSGKLENQIEHAEKALESVKKRLDTLRELLPNAPETKPSTAESDAKGKGKGKATTVQENPLGWTPKVESLESMTKSEIEAEIKDVTSLSEELQMKVRVVPFEAMEQTLTSGQLEDIRAIPADGVGGTTMDRVGRELDEELKNSGFGAPLAADQPVNDLTSMVKKKKPKPAAAVANPLIPDAAAVNPLVPDASVASLPSLGKRKAEEDPDRDEKKKRVE